MRETYWRTHKAKGASGLVPLLLLFMVASATGICVVVMKMTQSSQAAPSPADTPAVASPAPEPIKKARRQAAISKKRDGAAHVPSLERKNSRRIPNEVPLSEADQNAATLNVTTDSTPVFQSNSANSSLVMSLKKGEKVRSGGIEIIDPQGAWTLVREPGRSGFVPSELLERKTPSEESQ